MKKFIIVLVLALITNLSCTPKYRNIRSFETAWKTVNQEHYDPSFGGVDWKEAYEEYETKIVAVGNQEKAILLINQMLFKLNLSHFLTVYPDDMKKYMPIISAEGGIGIDVRLLHGETVITKVRSGSQAYQEGLRPGLVIEQIDDKPVEEIIQEGESLLIPPFNSRNRLNNLSSYISGYIYGHPKTDVKISFRDIDGDINEAVIKRKSRGRGRTVMAGMPPCYLEYEAKRLEQNIGYLRFNHWAEPVDTKFIAAIESMHDVRGLIIDLRGNPGGFFKVVHVIIKHLLSEKTRVSTWEYRNQRVDFNIDASRDAYLGKVAVLIDIRSTSSSEYFAGSMQAINRAVVIGERSPGSLLVANWKKLINGTSFMYAFAQPIMPDGKIIEGNGVVPDIRISLDRNELLRGKDNQLEAAISYILEN